MTALSGLAGGVDAHDGGELGAWSPDKVAEEPTALSLPCLPPYNRTSFLLVLISPSFCSFALRCSISLARRRRSRRVLDDWW